MQCSPPFFPLYIVHVSEDVVAAAQIAVYFFLIFASFFRCKSGSSLSVGILWLALQAF